MRTFAERLRFYRTTANLSQQALADKLGISVQTYNGYETKGYEPKYEILIKLAHALHVDVNALVGYDDDRLIKGLIGVKKAILMLDLTENVLGKEMSVKILFKGA